MTKFSYLDPKVIMTVVVALMLLAVGVFAFFTVTNFTQNQSGLGVSGTKTITVTGNDPWNVSGLPSITTNVSAVTVNYDDGSSASADGFVWVIAEPGAVRWINESG